MKIVISVFFTSLFVFSFSSISLALDREAEARKIFVENSIKLKDSGCSIISLIAGFSDNIFLNELGNEKTSEDQINSVFKIIECLNLYKKDILPISEKLINEFPETEAAFELVTGYYLSRKEVDQLEKLLLNLLNIKDVGSLADLLSLKNTIEEKKNDKINDETKDSNYPKKSKEKSLTRDEISNLKNQMKNCWTPPAGVVIKKGDQIKVQAEYKQDGKVIDFKVRVIDSNFSKYDENYKLIEESAIRTFLHPDCEYPNLPLEKYDAWKKITFTFDYSLMTK
jgi:hypothetical protein